MATIQADNRYSRVKYAQTKWGASAFRNAIAYGLEIDWNGDGKFDGSNESNRLVSFSGFNGRKNMLKPVASGFEQMEIGQYTFTLDNWDGRFSAWNTASPLYPNVSYGKDVKFTVRNLSGSVSPYPIFAGIISDIVPDYGDGTNPRVQIKADGHWAYLRNNKARVKIQSGIAPNSAMGMILDSVGWPVRWGRNLDISSDTIGYWWASGKNTAGAELENLANSGAGVFFVDAIGAARYMTRNDVPASSLSISESDLLKNVQPAQPWINNRTISRMTVHPMTLASSGVIWKLSGTAPTVLTGAANALNFTANYTYNGVSSPAINVLQPVATTDWKVTQNSDGTGTDYTSSCTFTIVDGGDTAQCTIVNNSGFTGFLSLAQIKGQSIYVQNTMDATYPSDPTTIKNPREFVQDLPWQQDINIAISIIGVVGAFFASNRPMVIVQMTGRPDIQFSLDIMNIISIDLPSIGFTGYSMRAAGIGMQSGVSPQEVITTLYLESYATVSGAGVFDSSVYDTAIYGW